MRNKRGLSPASRNRKTVFLNVQALKKTTRKRYQTRILNIIWRSSFIISLVVGSWLGANKLLNKFFYTNPDYQICHIIFTPETALAPEEIAVATGINLGNNIFTINLEQARKGLLSISHIHSAQIERVLPNTIRISVQLKVPVAWLMSEKKDKKNADPYTSPDSFLLEQEGTFYKPSYFIASYFSLPIIYGLDQRLLAMGDPLAIEDLSQALKLLYLAAQRHDPAISFRSLDLSKGYCIKAQGPSDEEIIFATENFEEQLNRLQDVMKFCSQTGKRMESVNLFVHRNTPVRWSVATKDNTISENNTSLLHQ